MRFLLLSLVICASVPGSVWAQGGKKSASDTPRPDAVSLEPCPSDASGIETFLNCTCPENASRGSVWGTGLYTGDSHICTAALHAGAVGLTGGAVSVTRHPGQASYAGSTQNDVTSRDWGSYRTSFEVRMWSASATPLANDDTGLPRCVAMPPDVAYFSCACPGGSTDGSVWGAGPFTADSDICTAARLINYIGEEGGNVYVIRVPGLAAYAGDEANGVTSASYGAYDSSIVFDWNR